MKIRIRLTLVYVFNTAVILFIFASSLFYSAKLDREKEFFTLLEKEAYSKARIHFHPQIFPTTQQQQFYHNHGNFIPEAHIAIYDSAFHLTYHDAQDPDILKENPQILSSFKNNKENHFIQNDVQFAGIHYRFKSKNYIVVAAAYDEYGFNKFKSFKKKIIQYLLIILLFIFIVGYYFSNNALAPIRDILRNVKNISAVNLDSRLQIKSSRDELSELAKAFNKMLDRLESSFIAQKHFVSNISHELRTPLTRLLGELEFTILKKRSEKEYQETLQVIYTDTQKLIKLTNTLLSLAKISGDNSEINFTVIRIDEILLDIQCQFLNKNPTYKMHIDFEKEIDNENDISIYGDEELLHIAFLNIIENSCKFSSDQESRVMISTTFQGVQLHFSDNGIGISQNDLANIFTAYYRGENRFFAEGNGIGLALTKKIIDLHYGFININSILQKGTTFIITIPRV